MWVFSQMWMCLKCKIHMSFSVKAGQRRLTHILHILVWQLLCVRVCVYSIQNAVISRSSNPGGAAASDRPPSSLL